MDPPRSDLLRTLGVYSAAKSRSCRHSGPRHPIDAFVVAKLKSQNLQSQRLRDASALCRRLYLDLIGLPPSPQELDAFEKTGFEATVESLLQQRTVRRKVGPALARRRPLFRHQRLRKGHAARAVDLARLGHRRPQSRHALRPVPDRADRRRPAARGRRRSRSSPPAFCATA